MTSIEKSIIIHWYIKAGVEGIAVVVTAFFFILFILLLLLRFSRSEALSFIVFFNAAWTFVFCSWAFIFTFVSCISPQFLHSLGESLGLNSWHCSTSLVRVQHIYRPFGCLLGYSHVDSCLQDQILHGHEVLLLSGQGDEDVAVFQTRSPPPRWWTHSWRGYRWGQAWESSSSCYFTSVKIDNF